MAENQTMHCKLNASIGKDGSLVIDVDSEECRNMVINAVSENGVSVIYKAPETLELHSDLG